MFPLKCLKRKKQPQFQLSSKHGEADVLIAHQAILVGQARVSILSGDTDVFTLLLDHYDAQNLQCPMIMQSPVHGRTCVDIPSTVKTHSNNISQVLVIHAISGCDTVADMYGAGLITTISVAKKGLSLDTIGKVSGDIKQIEKETTSFIVASYGSKLKCNSMKACRQCMWAQKTGKNTTSAPRLWSLPPTTETLSIIIMF